MSTVQLERCGQRTLHRGVPIAQCRNKAEWCCPNCGPVCGLHSRATFEYQVGRICKKCGREAPNVNYGAHQ